MKKVFLVEQAWDCGHKCFEDFNDALKYAIEQIEEISSTCTELGIDITERKLESLKELVTSIANRNVEKWGQGYAIDGFLYCQEIELIEKEDDAGMRGRQQV